MMNSLLFLTYINESKSMSCAKAVFRIIFYQYMLLFIGLSLGFIVNAEYVGYKSAIISKSIAHIFYPTAYTEEVVKNLKSFGSWKLYALNNYPNNFTVLEDAILAEEWYWCKFQYTNNHGQKMTDIQSTRLRWKPWEYYYDNGHVMTNDELKEYIKNGNLNSQESDLALRLRSEKLRGTENLKKHVDK